MDLRAGVEDRFADVVFVRSDGTGGGGHLAPEHVLPGGTDVGPAIDRVTAAAAARLVELLPGVDRGHLLGPVGGVDEPLVEFVARLVDGGVAEHGGVVRAAVFGAVDVVGSGLGGVDPHAVVAPRDDVLLDAERGDVKAVDDVLTLEYEPDGGVRGEVELVVAVAVGVAKGPLPHRAGDVDLVGVGGLDGHVQVAAETEVEDHEDQHGGDDRPGELEGGAVTGGGLVGLFAAAVAVLEDEADEQDGDEDEEEKAEPVDEREDVVDLGGEGGSPLGHPERWGGFGQDRSEHCVVFRQAAGGASEFLVDAGASGSRFFDSRRKRK
jgi:hypothetical protein